jgi:fido (protein-threonine AMPylation protein)
MVVFDDTRVDHRQREILDILSQSGYLSRKEIGEQLSEPSRGSKVTLIRELNGLIGLGMLESKGQGRGVKYGFKNYRDLFRFIDLKDYFSVEVDRREIAYDRFEAKIIKEFSNLLSSEERRYYEGLNNSYIKVISELGEDVRRKELERLVIELSWKSSRIEGNTYSLLETELLIKDQKEASGHSREEAVMILNHKRAFDMILAHVEEYRELSLKALENLHSELVKDLDVSRGLRSQAVGITGTNYRPPDNQWQVREMVEVMLKRLNDLESPLEKALSAVVLVSYIQPFVDGNKRTARLLGNAILLAGGYCPLSYRNVDEVVYKQSLILFYEQHSLYHFKKLFLDQFEFAVENYFRS